MIDKQIINELSISKILGYFGISSPEEANPYYSKFSFKRKSFILYFTKEGPFILDMSKLKRYTHIQFLLTYVSFESLEEFESKVKAVTTVSENYEYSIPSNITLVDHKHILPNILALKGKASNNISEESNRLVFNFATSNPLTNDFLYNTAYENTFTLIILNDEKKITNALTFNLALREDFLTSNSFFFLFKKSDSKIANFHTGINSVIKDKKYEGTQNQVLFKLFDNSNTFFKYSDFEEVNFYIKINEYSLIVEQLLNQLKEEKKIGMFSITESDETITISVSGFSTRPFAIDDVFQPLNTLIRKTLTTDEYAINDEVDFLINSKYKFRGKKLLGHSHGPTNSMTITLPLAMNLLKPLFNHFAKHSAIKFNLFIVK